MQLLEVLNVKKNNTVTDVERLNKLNAVLFCFQEPSAVRILNKKENKSSATAIKEIYELARWRNNKAKNKKNNLFMTTGKSKVSRKSMVSHRLAAWNLRMKSEPAYFVYKTNKPAGNESDDSHVSYCRCTSYKIFVLCMLYI